MSQTTIINDVLEPLTEMITPDMAERIADLQVKPEVQSRVDELAGKCNEGELTEAELEEYETYVRVGNIFAILKAKAKAILANGHNG